MTFLREWSIVSLNSIYFIESGRGNRPVDTTATCFGKVLKPAVQIRVMRSMTHTLGVCLFIFLRRKEICQNTYLPVSPWRRVTRTKSATRFQTVFWTPCWSRIPWAVWPARPLVPPVRFWSWARSPPMHRWTFPPLPARSFATSVMMTTRKALTATPVPFWLRLISRARILLWA